MGRQNEEAGSNNCIVDFELVSFKSQVKIELVVSGIGKTLAHRYLGSSIMGCIRY